MIQDIKRHFRKLTPLEVASKELIDAQLAKLEAETGQEYAASQVAYNTARIKRLKSYIATLTEEEQK